MRSTPVFLSAGLLCALGMMALTGCETGRSNKLHSRFEIISDVSTVPHPLEQYASVSTGITPVPGSPTAAGPDGRQPANDYEARRSPGTEKGTPTPPRKQDKDRFIRQ